jgi:hypothetical protein
MTRQTFRDGDTMIAVETAPATIDYADILEATEVVAEEGEYQTPWDQCDGYAHTYGATDQFDGNADCRAMRGFCWTDRQRVVIQLAPGEDYGIYDSLRKAGASKQVAREAVAAARRQTLDQLVEWYENGWNWYGVRCHVTILGEEFEDSVWGIDNADYAEKEVIPEVASEMVGQLEKAGYTVVGQPKPETRLTARRFGAAATGKGIKHDFWPRSMPAAEWRDEYTRNLNSQNWKA